jgi:TonB family protein
MNARLLSCAALAVLAGCCGVRREPRYPPPDSGIYGCVGREGISYAHVAPIPYPHDALEARVAGVVYVGVTVDADGQISATELVLADPPSASMLADAAIEGIRSWRFNAETHCNTAVRGRVLVPVRFILDPSAPVEPIRDVDGFERQETIDVRAPPATQ